MISYVIPVMNEEESIDAFYAELYKVILQIIEKYEIIFIDDGSTDNSLVLLKKLVKSNKSVRVFSFRRNLGKAEALTFGFAKASGDYIVTLDADLQDIPSEIPKLLALGKTGVEVVTGWRKKRKDKKYMVYISRLFNLFVNKLFNTGIHDYNCGLKLYTRDAAKSLQLYGGLYRFIPFLVYQQGFTIGEVAVEHQPRKFGKSKYGFYKWRDLPDIITILFLAKYSKRPLHFFGIIGIFMSSIGVIVLLYLTYVHYFMHQPVGTRPLLFMGILFVIAGLQILFTGFLADLMLNIAQGPKYLDESKMHFPLKFSTD